MHLEFRHVRFGLVGVTVGILGILTFARAGRSGGRLGLRMSVHHKPEGLEGEDDEHPGELPIRVVVGACYAVGVGDRLGNQGDLLRKPEAPGRNRAKALEAIRFFDGHVVGCRQACPVLTTYHVAHLREGGPEDDTDQRVAVLPRVVFLAC